MRYQIGGGGWAVGQYLIPAGTIIDASVLGQWSALTQGRTPPYDSVALDQAAYSAMLAAYPGTPPGVISSTPAGWYALPGIGPWCIRKAF